jgi:hypothetical protein
MSSVFSLLATYVVVVLGLWLLGGIVLRVGGAMLAAGGLLDTAATGSPVMVITTVVGTLAWLAGHWLFALRHHYFRSPLARRIFLEAVPTLNPTRRWGVPNIPPKYRR